LKLYEYILSFREDATDKLAKIAGASNKVSDRLAKTSSVARAAGDSIGKLANNSASSEKAIKKAGAAASEAAAKLNSKSSVAGRLAGSMSRATKTVSNAGQAIKGFVAKALRGAQAIRRLGKEASQSEQLVSRLKGAIAGFAIGSAIIAGATSVAKLGINMEQTRVSFTTFLGSAGRANAVLSDLNEFANVTPFDNNQVIKAGKVLTAFGTKQKELIPTLRKIGDIAAGTGKDFNELSVIYGKARIAGTLYAEDINQLVEAGVPIMGEFAKALNTTEGNVKKMASQGKLKFKDLEQAFTNLTGEGGMFFNLMKKQSETVGGRLSTLQGKLQLMGIQLGERLLPAMGSVVDKALQLTAWTDRNSDSIANFLGIVGVAGGALLAYKLVMGGTAIATKLYTAASVSARLATILLTGGFTKLNLVLGLNPVGLVVAAFVALASAAVYAYYKFEWFRGLVWGLGAAIKEFVSIVVNGWIKAFKSAITIVTSFGQAVWALMKGDFRGAIEEGKKVTSGFKDLVSGALDAVPLSAALRNGKKLGETFGKAYKEGVEDFNGVRDIKNQKVKITTGKEALGPEAANPLVPFSASQQTGATTQGAKGGNDAKTKKGIDSISGGGSRQTNVNISMGSIVAEQNFNVRGVQEAINDMDEAIKEALIRVLNASLQVAQ